MPPPPKLSGFEFVRLLGEGAFGQVWLARDTRLDVPRAVKLVNKEKFTEAGAARLAAEARTLARLPRHPNRVEVHQLVDGVLNCFLVMDYVPGGSLDRATSPDRPMDWRRAARYVAGAGAALEAVHAAGLVHRDIKPDNLLLDPDRDEAVVGDFGLAADDARVGYVAGTPGYLAPEVLAGRGSAPAADVFALAATLLHLATGRRPARAAAAEEHPGWTDLPAELRAVISAGMAPDPAERATLPAFLGAVREARWAAAARAILGADAKAGAKVRLRVTAAVAPPDDPRAFGPVPPGGATTGDLVRVEAAADADGFHTVLVLGSSGDVGVALPRANEPAYRFAANQPHALLLRLTPPAGTERVLVVWSRRVVRRTAAEWAAWLEAAGVDLPARTRGLEVLGSAPAAPPEGDWRAVVVPIPHATPAA